jgi:protein involved in polysaccharide export with SLBB domain
MLTTPFLSKTLGVAGMLALLFGVQTASAQNRNNPYSPSPDKATSAPGPVSHPTGQDNTVSFRLTSDTKDSKAFVEPTSVAETAYKAPRLAVSKPASPSEIYKIGIGDVLFVNLKNAPNGSGYFTVRADGTIDYPLAGEKVIVAEQTAAVAAEIIAGGIRVFASPQVEVKVREYASHKVNVTGSVENAGEKSLQREAMPLFAIRAEALPNAKTSKVRIKRAGSTNDEVLNLRDVKSDETLIFPGDHVHFFTDTAGAVGSYFISGEIASGGQKDLAAGLTLYQAIIASGGAKGDPKKATIRRKNEKGMLAAIDYNLRSIKDGKAMDPFVAAGDIIEIRN